MMNPTLLTRVKEVLAQEWKMDPATIPDDAELNRFDRWDSLGHINILLALQASFALELTADTVQALISLPRIVEHLASRPLASAA